MTRVNLAALGSDGTLGGPGGSPLTASVGNVASAYANAGSSSPFGDVVSGVDRIDLCRPPYNCVPNVGTDWTATVQSAVNTYVVAGAVVEFYFSDPGNYNFNGAVQSGTVDGRAYAGQVLIPAVAWSGQSAMVFFRGFGATPMLYNPTSAVTFTTNATSGSIFSCIPTTGFAQSPWSNLWLRFEDISFQLPSIPQCGAVDGTNAWELECRRIRVNGGGTAASQTGTVPALASPLASCNGSTFDEIDVRACGVAMTLTDHTRAERVYLGGNGVGISGSNAVGADVHRVWLSGNAVGIQPTSTLTIEGEIGWEAGGLTSALLINDPSGHLHGSLRYLQGDALPLQGIPSITGGSTGGSRPSFNISHSDGDSQGWKGMHPYDTFARPVTAPAGGDPGLCSETLHPWRVVGGSFSTATGALTQTSSSQSQAMVPVKNGIQGGETRSINASITLPNSSGIKVGVIGNGGVGPTGTIQAWFQTAATSPNLLLLVNGTTVVTLAAYVTNNATYALTLVVIMNSQGVPARARVLVGGVEAIDYALSPSQQANLGAGTTFCYMEDGVLFGGSSDSGSIINTFKVRPLAGNESQFGITKTAVAATRTAQHSETTLCSSGTFTVTLPAPVAGIPPNVIINQGTGTITVAPPSGTLTNLSGATGNITLTQGVSAKIISTDGTNFVQVV